LLGEPSGGLVDVDLDCEEAEALAGDFLPHTGMIHGRPGRERSHWWYRVEEPPDKASERFTDVDGAMLLELRSTGGQTVVPPSLATMIGEDVVKRAREWLSDRQEDEEAPPARVKESAWLVQSAEGADLELFHDAQEAAYAALNVNGHREVLAVDGKGFRRWLA